MVGVFGEEMGCPVVATFGRKSRLSYKHGPPLIWLAALVGAVQSESCLGKSLSRNDSFGAHCSNERTVGSFIALHRPVLTIQGAVTRRTCQVAISLIRFRLRGAALRHRSVTSRISTAFVAKWPSHVRCDGLGS